LEVVFAVDAMQGRDIKIFACRGVERNSRSQAKSRSEDVGATSYAANRQAVMVWVVATLLAVYLILPPATAIAAGVFGAPPLKSITQIKVDDDAKKLVYPNALAYDPVLEEIYVTNGGSLRVIVYGPDFFPRISIGAGRGVISPSGLAVMANGEVYVCQVRSRINPSPRITVLNGAFFVDREIFFDRIPEAADFIPKRIVVSRDGIIYLAGENARGLMVMNDEGDFLRWLKPMDMVYARNLARTQESTDDEQEQPEESLTSAGVDEEDTVEEDDPFADIPEEFRPIVGVGREDGVIGSGKVEGPVVLNFVTIDSTGKLYMISNETGKVYVYGPDENFLFSFGTKGGSPGQMSQPRALAIDEEQELIYVADYMRHTILIYNLDGEYLFEVGGRGTDPGWFNFPTEMTINKHRQIIVADLFNGRVQVLELGYEEWQRRYELEPPIDDFPEESETDAEAISEQSELAPAEPDAASDLTDQPLSSRKLPEDEFEASPQETDLQVEPATGVEQDQASELDREKPESRFEVNIAPAEFPVESAAENVDVAPEAGQQQSGDVLEVIFDDEEIPTFPVPEEK